MDIIKLVTKGFKDDRQKQLASWPSGTTFGLELSYNLSSEQINDRKTTSDSRGLKELLYEIHSKTNSGSD